MKKELKYLNLYYTDKDIDYIDELINSLNEECEKIVNFFDINNFEQKAEVKLFDDLDEYRNHIQEIINKEVPLWLCGLSYNLNHIDTLSLTEYKKTESHENCDINDLKCLILHEFTHMCHKLINPNMGFKWIGEGLATTLSHQYDNLNKEFNATVDDLLYNQSKYNSHYLFFNYVLDKYGKDYILKLLKNEKLCLSETEKLHNEYIIQLKKENKIK